MSRMALAATMFVLVMPAAFEAVAQEKPKSDGVVIAIRDGRFERLEQERWNPLAVGQDIYRTDRVRTDSAAVATVTLAGVGRIVIGPSTDLELGKDPGDFQIRMQRGFAWFESNLPKGSRASITTSLATAGVRGTGFSVCYDGENYCACTCFGKVEVALADGRVVEVPKGEHLSFTARAPVPATTAPAATLLEKTGAGYDFCFNCHVVGGKGALKQARK
jgi:hypothetical protein